jgi:hypothetical protein
MISARRGERNWAGTKMAFFSSSGLKHQLDLNAKEIKAIIDKDCEAIGTPGEPDSVSETTSAFAQTGVKKTL